MSFRIFASGTRGFRESRDNNPDEDIFQAAAVISAINSSGPTVGGVVDGVRDYQGGSDVLDQARSLARASFAYQLRSAVDSLAMCQGAANGWISVYAVRRHLLWPDTNSHTCYRFAPGEDPGSEFIRMILPGLTSTGFNHYGSFRAMALMIARYNDRIGNVGTPILRLELST
jgi:hypothetical protein